MRPKTWPLLFVLFAGILSSPHAAASSKTETAGGLHLATFEDQRGTVTVYLPDDLAAGDTISGTVTVEASGRTAEQKRRNSGELRGYVVEIEDQKSPADAGSIKRNVPAALAGGTMRVVLRDERGREVGVAAVPVLDASATSNAGFELPRIGQTGRTAQVTGPFDGDSATTRAAIGGRDVKVLAESPRRIVVQCPEDVVGPAEIEIREGDAAAKGEFRNVQVLLSAPKLSLSRGERTEMRVEVRGLDGLEEPLELRVVNRSPSVVRVEGGDTQTFSIRPGDVSSEGGYTTTRTLAGSRAGSFDVSADLVPGPVFQPAPQPEPSGGQPGPAQPQPPAPRRKPGEGDLPLGSRRTDTVENLPGGRTIEIKIARIMVNNFRDRIEQTVDDYNGMKLDQVIAREYKKKEIDGKEVWVWEVVSDSYSETRTDEKGQVVRKTLTTYHRSGGAVETELTRKIGEGRLERWKLGLGGHPGFVKVDDRGRPVLDQEGKPVVATKENFGEVPFPPEWLELELPQK